MFSDLKLPWPSLIKLLGQLEEMASRFFKPCFVSSRNTMLTPEDTSHRKDVGDSLNRLADHNDYETKSLAIGDEA